MGESRAQELGDTMFSAYRVESVAINVHEISDDQDTEL